MKIELDKTLIDTWTSVVLKYAKFSNKQAHENIDPISHLIKQEKNNIYSMWEAYTKDRSSLGLTALNTKKSLVSYLLGFHLSNASRMKTALMRLENRDPKFLNSDLLSQKISSINIHDFGCGTGAMSHSLISHKLNTQHEKLNVFLYDRASLLLQAAKECIEGLCKCNITTAKLDVDKINVDKLFSSSTENTLNIYIAGYLWNELQKNSKATSNFEKLLLNIARHDSNSLVFLFDPANRIPCTRLMMLRDVLINNNLHSLYPCPRSLPCPMLKHCTDWCYSEAEWSQPQSQKLLDTLLKINRSKVASTMFVFANNAFMQSANIDPHDNPVDTNPVVVGRPVRKQKHIKGVTSKEFDYLLCNGKSISKKSPKSQISHIKLRGESL